MCFGGQAFRGSSNDTLALRADARQMTRASSLEHADTLTRVRRTATKVFSFQVERGRYKSDRGAARNSRLRRDVRRAVARANYVKLN